MRDFILRSKLAKKTVAEGDLSELKAFLKNIGSNFILQGGKFEFLAQFEWELASRSDAFSDWHGWQESNPRKRFWRPLYYHYTTPANKLKSRKFIKSLNYLSAQLNNSQLYRLSTLWTI